MRISSQNNQFIFTFPYDFVEEYLEIQFNKLMVKNFIPYDTIIDYINSTIKEVVVPSLAFNFPEQRIKRGKTIAHKESQSVFDKYTNEIDITFRSVDSYLNYFILQQILVEFYLNNDKRNIPLLHLSILDKDGDLIYTLLFREVLLKSISEVRLGYQQQDIAEKPFTVTFRYNWIDIRWELDDDDVKTNKSIFDVPINFKKGKLDQI